MNAVSPNGGDFELKAGQTEEATFSALVYLPASVISILYLLQLHTLYEAFKDDEPAFAFENQALLRGVAFSYGTYSGEGDSARPISLLPLSATTANLDDSRSCTSDSKGSSSSRVKSLSEMIGSYDVMSDLSVTAPQDSDDEESLDHFGSSALKRSQQFRSDFADQ